MLQTMQQGISTVHNYMQLINSLTLPICFYNNIIGMTKLMGNFVEHTLVCEEAWERGPIALI